MNILAEIYEPQPFTEVDDAINWLKRNYYETVWTGWFQNKAIVADKLLTFVNRMRGAL